MPSYSLNIPSVFPSPNDDRRLKALQLLLRQHPKLYDFLIHPELKWLRRDPQILLKSAGVFSSGEKVLVEAALDLCFNHSNSRLWDIVNRLDSENFKNVMQALVYLRTTEN